jgi:hypothetical protein
MVKCNVPRRSCTNLLRESQNITVEGFDVRARAGRHYNL